MTMERVLAATTSDSKQSLPHLPRLWFQGKEQRPGNQPESGSTSRGEKQKRLGFWLRLLLLMFLVNLFFYGPLLPALFQGQPSTVDLPYTSFVQQVEQGNVTSVIMSGNALSGTFKTPLRQQQTGSDRGALVASHFTTYVPATGDPNL